MSKQSTSNPSTIATGTKVKDPRRVAAGKRLAAILDKRKRLNVRNERHNGTQGRQVLRTCKRELVTVKLYISSVDYSW